MAWEVTTDVVLWRLWWLEECGSALCGTDKRVWGVDGMEMVWRRWLREGKEDLSRIDSFVDIIMRVATRLGVAAEFFLIQFK